MPPTTADLTIRLARETECSAILDLWKRAGATPTVTDNVGSLLRLIREHNSLLVAEVDAAVIASQRSNPQSPTELGHNGPTLPKSVLLGTVIAGWDGWRGSIYRLAVLPAYRKRGIGRALVAAAERHLITRGAKRLITWPDHSHTEANYFWKQMETRYGYILDDHARRYFKDLA